MVDKFTKERSMIRYARILVEMEIIDNPPSVIYFVNEKGQVQEQHVEYDWLPTKCNNCKGYGHSMADCKKAVTNKWVKKDITTEGKPDSATVDAETATGGTIKVPDLTKKDLMENQVTGVEFSKDSVVKEITGALDNKDNLEVPKKTRNS